MEMKKQFHEQTPTLARLTKGVASCCSCLAAFIDFIEQKQINSKQKTKNYSLNGRKIEKSRLNTLVGIWQ